MHIIRLRISQVLKWSRNMTLWGLSANLLTALAKRSPSTQRTVETLLPYARLEPMVRLWLRTTTCAHLRKASIANKKLLAIACPEA